MNAKEIKPGKLVELRKRKWIVLPTDDKDLLRIKPLGGAEEEITSVYLPFAFKNEEFKEYYFPQPTEEDLGDLQSAQLLYDAVRLSFRDASGPFRSIAKFNFSPRAYQMVPLIMALRQDETVRLFIADDVGIGKTVESLMIVQEMLSRGDIKRFAVVCLPHLCEQWQEELQQKFGIEAVIVRSSTAASLDRRRPGDVSAFKHYDAQIVSIDYVKTPRRVDRFVQDCPEMVIVDEAHTCSSGNSKGRQLRHQLLERISQKTGQHLLMLSATPHSGKADEFQSLLGLLKPEFGDLDLTKSSRSGNFQLAKHFVQRRRKDIEKWGEGKTAQETHFPQRESIEVAYALSPDHLQLQYDIMDLARTIATSNSEKRHQKLNYWTALALLRGVMSSPAMGRGMLEKRAGKALEDEELDVATSGKNPILDDDYGFEGDVGPLHLSTNIAPASSPKKMLELAERLQAIEDNDLDFKVKQLVKLVKKWLKEGFNPIIYCRYIRTAEYVGKALGNLRGVAVAVVTSKDPDETRLAKVDALGEKNQRVLVATDCMSEGINLQRHFTAVIHYDLPWNPNRLEQREGRVDRFGQPAPIVRAALLYGEDNPMDGIVLKVLLRKAREIKKAIGVSVPFPEGNVSIMEAVTQAVLLREGPMPKVRQGNLFLDMVEVQDAESEVEATYREIESREVASRAIFAQHAVKAQEVDKDLSEAIRLIGDMDSVERFTVRAIKHLGGGIVPYKEGYKFFRNGAPFAVSHLFDEKKKEMLISFATPTPDGYRYIARNHDLVDTLCQLLISEAMTDKGAYRVSRSSVVRTTAVAKRTTVILLRVRNVIQSLATKTQIVAEELILRGYAGEPPADPNDWLDEETCMALLQTEATGEVPTGEKRQLLEYSTDDLEDAAETLNELARNRAVHLIEAHNRFSKQTTGSGRKTTASYEPVEPILPMDVMGIYVFTPDLGNA
jgi:superfamily II DNA or RNA helicase